MTAESSTRSTPRCPPISAPRRLRWALRWLTSIALLAVLGAAPARAQVGVEEEDEAMEMGMEALTRKGFDKYVSILRLDDDQKEAARMLFDGYREGVRDQGKQIKAFMEEWQQKVQDSGGDYMAVQKEMAEKMKGFQDRVKQLETGFFDDVKSMLRDDQAARWPKLERFRHREEGMQYGMFVSGAGVDLVAVAEKLKLDTESNAALAEQFDQYELDVDKHLGVLKQTAEKMQEDAMESMGDFDMSNYTEMMEKVAAPARQIRDINRQYARLIIPLLPPEQAGKFDAEFKLRAFPRVYRRSHAAKALAAADGFSDLTPEQRQGLTDIRASYERGLVPANEKWATEIEKKDNESGGGMMQMMMGQFGGDDADDPVSQARKARRELDDQARERIVALLTEDQRSRLPEKGPTQDNPWDDFHVLQDGDEEEPE